MQPSEVPLELQHQRKKWVWVWPSWSSSIAFTHQQWQCAQAFVLRIPTSFLERDRSIHSAYRHLSLFLWSIILQRYPILQPQVFLPDVLFFCCQLACSFHCWACPLASSISPAALKVLDFRKIGLTLSWVVVKATNCTYELV